jgi:hypothetical protein
MTGHHDSSQSCDFPKMLDTHQLWRIAESLSTMVSHGLEEPSLHSDF